jgi:hypothetical protein
MTENLLFFKNIFGCHIHECRERPIEAAATANMHHSIRHRRTDTITGEDARSKRAGGTRAGNETFHLLGLVFEVLLWLWKKMKTKIIIWNNGRDKLIIVSTVLTIYHFR